MLHACEGAGIADVPSLTLNRTWYYIYGNVMEQWATTMESAITTKGQATIPKAIREHLHLKPGDRVKFFVHPDGTVFLLPKIPVSALRGIVKARRRVTLEEMEEAIAAGATEAYRARSGRNDRPGHQRSASLPGAR